MSAQPAPSDSERRSLTSSMRDSLLKLAESAEMVIASANGVLDPAEIDPLRESVRNLRTRLGFPEGTIVVVLAGGTGSGKSSLFNVLVGSEVADVGGVRPTTTEPMASVPADSAEAVTGLIERLGIEPTNVHPGEFCVIDLPDYDSVEESHRRHVDDLLPLVDVVVWVVDPEKYRDARLHNEYLQPSAPYSDQFVVALNQVDRLGGSHVDSVLADLRVALEEDGLNSVPIVKVSARPPAGPPTGIDQLVSVLSEMGDAGMTKLGTDIREIAGTLADRLGSGLDFDRRAAEVVERAAADVAKGETAQGSTVLIRFLEEIATASGGPVADSIRRLAADVPRHMARIGEEATPDVEKPRFGRRVSPTEVDRAVVAAAVKSDIIRPARALLAKRAVAVAALAEFVVELQAVNPTSEN